MSSKHRAAKHTRSAGEVRVDDLIWIGIEFDEHLENEFSARNLVAWRALVFREIIDQMRVLNLLFEHICLIEEQNYRGVLKPGVGYNRSKQGFRFFHAILTKNNTEQHHHLFISQYFLEAFLL